MEYTLKEVEDFFKYKLLNTVPKKYISDINICCSSLEFISLLKIANSLKNIYEMIDKIIIILNLSTKSHLYFFQIKFYCVLFQIYKKRNNLNKFLFLSLSMTYLLYIP